jgi:hypothetical protein
MATAAIRPGSDRNRARAAQHLSPTSAAASRQPTAPVFSKHPLCRSLGREYLTPHACRRHSGYSVHACVGCDHSHSLSPPQIWRVHASRCWAPSPSPHTAPAPPTHVTASAASTSARLQRKGGISGPPWKSIGQMHGQTAPLAGSDQKCTVSGARTRTQLVLPREVSPRSSAASRDAATHCANPRTTCVLRGEATTATRGRSMHNWLQQSAAEAPGSQVIRLVVTSSNTRSSAAVHAAAPHLLSHTTRSRPGTGLSSLSGRELARPDPPLTRNVLLGGLFQEKNLLSGVQAAGRAEGRPASAGRAASDRHREVVGSLRGPPLGSQWVWSSKPGVQVVGSGIQRK